MDGPETPMLALFSSRLQNRCSPSWRRENGKFYFSLSSSKPFIFLVMTFWFMCLGMYFFCTIYCCFGFESIFSPRYLNYIFDLCLCPYVWSISLDLYTWIYLLFDAFERYPDLIHTRSLFMFVLFRLYALEVYHLLLARKLFFSILLFL